MLPLFVNITDRLCAVIGGGPVGRRKAHALLEAGARVRLVCLEPPCLSAERLSWLTEAYRPEHLDGAVLACAAATPEVNSQVVTDARQRGIWVNAAHDPESGDVYMPSIVRRGDFVLAIGSLGAAPALSLRVRERLETEFDEAFGVWVRLLGEMRPEVLVLITDADRRRAFFAHLSDWVWLERLRRDGESAVRRAMRQELHRASGGLLE
jgi:precorrin-2 dehydrogenase